MLDLGMLSGIGGGSFNLNLLESKSDEAFLHICLECGVGNLAHSALPCTSPVHSGISGHFVLGGVRKMKPETKKQLYEILGVVLAVLLMAFILFLVVAYNKGL
jgi:hypothetical protein